MAFRIGLFVLETLVVASVTAEACEPPVDQYSTLERFERSDVVLQGQVFSVEEIACPPRPEMLPQTNERCGRRLRILALNRIKGDVPDILEIEEPYTPCFSLSVARGHRMFFFFQREVDGELSTFMPWWGEDSAITLFNMTLEEFRRQTIDRPPTYMPNGDPIVGAGVN